MNNSNIERIRAEKLNAIYQKYDNCAHQITDLRIRTFRNGSEHYVMQCMDCGSGRNGITKQEALKINKNPQPFDECIKQQWENKRQTKIDEVIHGYESTKAAKKADFDDWYGEYLKSEKWRCRRQLVLERDGHTCQGCLREKATQVHHMTYAHVGDELLFELVSICDACHEIAHRSEE